MSAPCKILPFPQRPVRASEPPVNPWLELTAWWLAWQAEWLHTLSAMLRPRR